MVRRDNSGALWHRYPLVCTALGLGLGWGPVLFHGPIPEKFDVFYLHGAVAVWAFYTARLLIGFLVGITTWPEPWLLRGPLIGGLTMLPVTFVALATPGCGPTWMMQNLATGAVVGMLVGGIAHAITGKQHR